VPYLFAYDKDFYKLDYPYREDRFTILSFEEIKNQLGEPELQSTIRIGASIDVTQIEPYYPLYFSECELNNTVIIYNAEWHIEDVKIKIWLKKINASWICFKSIEHGEDVLF
jgi:hypothetical protein